MKQISFSTGWCEVTLSDIADINPTTDKSVYDDDTLVSFVPMPAVEAESGQINVTQLRKFGEVKKGYTPFTEGDVLFAKITPCMENGKMAIVPTLHNEVGFGSTEFHVLRPYTGINSQFLYYFISSKSFRNEAEHKMTGAVGQKRVPTTYIQQALINLPPSNEQKRIVSKIEELFSELDKGIESLKTARAKLKIYHLSILDAAAHGRLPELSEVDRAQFTEDKYVNLGSLVLEMGQGWSPKCKENPSPNEKIWGVIKTTAIQHLLFNDSENKELPSTLAPREHLEIKSGDILITRAGPRNRVGVACLVEKTRRRLILCDKAYRVRVDQKKILPEYLVMLLNTPKIMWKIEEIKTGINDSGVNLTQDRFLDLRMPVPEIEVQKNILESMNRTLSNLNYLELQLNEALSISAALRQSILQKAFSGQLVAQDSSDEPASVLLERIRAEKEKALDKKPKTKRRAA